MAKRQSMSGEAVFKATGKHLKDWFAILRKMGAAKMTHKEIALALHQKHKVPGWWSQMVTVEFERETGKRQLGQTCYGDFQVTVTKTVSGSLDQALQVWQKMAAGHTGFSGVSFEGKPAVSKSEKWRYWRVPLSDGSRVVAVIGVRGPGKSQIAINHEKIQSRDSADGWRTFWKSFLQGPAAGAAA
jgi:hypothetical protein